MMKIDTWEDAGSDKGIFNELTILHLSKIRAREHLAQVVCLYQFVNLYLTVTRAESCHPCPTYD